MDVLEQIMHKLPGEHGRKAGQTQVMTIRLPSALHASLKEEARARNTSANRLAVAKLSIKASILDKVAEMVKEPVVAVE